MATTATRQQRPSSERTAGDRDRRIGQRIRALRRSSGQSQGGLAVTLGLSYQQINKYERGHTRLTISRAVDLLAACGTDDLNLLRPSTPLGRVPTLAGGRMAARVQELMKKLSTSQQGLLVELAEQLAKVPPAEQPHEPAPIQFPAGQFVRPPHDPPAPDEG